MKKLYLLFIVLSVLFGVGLTPAAFGGSKKKPTPAPVHHPVISSVTATTVTVTEEKSARTLTISPFTEIFVNGVKATAADLKPGMTVNITLGTDPSKASRINATGK